MSKRKLLLADDSVTIQKVVNLTFADEGIDVITVGDGDTAMERIAETQPDLVLADVHMPGLNGYEICEILRDNEATRNLPVVLLVGSFEPFDEEEAHRVGASAYLTKPFQSIRQLVSQVTDLMGATAPSNGAEPEQNFDAATEDEPENDDIENLYRESVSEAAETPPAVQHTAAAFTDAGMDDEIIETSHVDDLEPKAADQGLAAAAGSDFEQVNDGGWESERAEPDQRKEVGHNLPVYGRFTETEQLDFVPEPIGESKSVGDEAARFDTRPELLSSPSFAFDEVDLLEIPAVDSGKAIEFTTLQQALDTGSKTKAVSLSPELIDIIVQKVVEKLSEKY